MPMYHAVLLIDHHQARILQFDAEHSQLETLKAHAHPTRSQGGDVRAEHEFFGQVCDALKGIGEVMVAGAHQAQADFHHYIRSHRPAVAGQIAHWETVDHPSDGQLVAHARRWFDHRNGMPGASRPG